MAHIVFAAFDRPDISSVVSLFPVLRRAGHEVSVVNKYLNSCSQDDLPHVKVVTPPLNQKREALSSHSGQRSAIVNTEEIEQLLGWNAYRKLLSIKGIAIDIVERFQDYRVFIEQYLTLAKPDLLVLCPGEVEAAIIAGISESYSIPYCFLLPPYYEFTWTTSFTPYSNAATYLVCGQLGEERLEQKGVPPGRIIRIGSSRLDSHYGKPDRYSEAAKLNRGALRLLFTMQDLPASNELLDLLVKYVSQRKNVRLVVRPHPSKPFARRRQWKYLWRGVLFDTQRHVNDSLRAASLLTTVSSGTILDAIICGVPIVCYDSNLLPCTSPFARNGEIAFTRTYGELQSALDSLLFDQATRATWLRKQPDLMLKYIGSLDGEVATRAVEVILSLTKPT